MAISEFIILAGMIIVGFIFFLVAQGFISGELLSTKEKMYQTESQEIVSLIERSTSEQGPYFYYFREISFSNVSVKNKILTYQKGSYKFSYPVPKEVVDSDLENVTSICVLKKTGEIKLLDKCPKCNMDSVCSQDECKEDCPDCYGPSSICVGDGFCNKGIGENCENSVDCKCQGLCCPTSPDSDNNGCTSIGNIERSKQCWCNSQCQSGLECNPTAPTFSSYPKACCDPHKGWNGTDCVNIECPQDKKCPGAPMNGGNGDNAWTDINSVTCCSFSDVGDVSGPICSSSHCCPTTKPKWCNNPQTGNPRCVDNNEFVSEKCEEICPSSITQCFNKWHWNGYGAMFQMNVYGHVCDYYEVCQVPVVQPIAKEIIECCDNKCAGSCHSMCNQALSDSGLSSTDNDNTRKKCYGLYTIYGMDGAARWLKGYLLRGYPNGPDPPEAPASVMLSGDTWMCTGYSIVLTTLLRSVGYQSDEAYSVGMSDGPGCGHAFNLVKFPGESNYRFVDTVGNGLYISGITSSDWYRQQCGACRTESLTAGDGCQNDEGVFNCPSSSNVYLGATC
jgi:hypothetical protein